MKDFLLNNYSILYRSVIFLAAIIGLFSLRKFKKTHSKFFIWFLVYVFFLEIFAAYPTYLANYKILSPINEFINDSGFKQNYWFYTIFWSIGGILFYSYYYQKVLRNKTFLKILKYATYVFLICSIVFIAFNMHTFFNSTIPFIDIIGAVIIFLCASFYFIEILRNEKILNYWKSLDFYISIVIFIWWLLTTPVVFYESYIASNDWDFILLRFQLFLLANIFMYLTFVFALLWCEPEQEL
jgi:hypothetical protein